MAYMAASAPDVMSLHDDLRSLYCYTVQFELDLLAPREGSMERVVHLGAQDD